MTTPYSKLVGGDTMLVFLYFQSYLCIYIERRSFSGGGQNLGQYFFPYDA